MCYFFLFFTLLCRYSFVCHFKRGDETSVLTNQIIITIISDLISCYVYPSVSPNHLCHSSSSPFSLHFLPFLPFLSYLALPPFTSHIITRVPSFLCIPLLLYLRPILYQNRPHHSFLLYSYFQISLSFALSPSTSYFMKK